MAKKKSTPVKKTAKPKPKKEETPVVAELSAGTNKKIGRIVVLMTKVYDIGIIEEVCRKDLGIPENEIDTAITKARGELVKATGFHVKEEYGRALLALRELFTSSVKLKDNKTALAILKELIRLQGFFDKERKQQTDPENTGSVELDRIREQLVPFRLTPDETAPVSELIRLLLIDYMRLIHDSRQTRPAPGSHGPAQPPAIAGPSGDLSAPADQKPRKKK